MTARRRNEMPGSLSLRACSPWLVPLVCWVAVQACSSNADRSPSALPAAAGGEATGGNGPGPRAQAGRENESGGAVHGAGTGGSVFAAGEAGAVGIVGESGASGAGAESGAGGSANSEGGHPSAGAKGDAPAPICGTTQEWVDGSALPISTLAAVHFGSITPDELTVAWATSPNGVITIQYADRTARDASFGAPKSFVGQFALDRAALSSDGLRLVLVNADRRGFTEYTRASRDDDFGTPSMAPFAALQDYAQHTMLAANAFADPLLDPDDKAFLYSEYGGGSVDTIQRARRLFSGDPWSVGSPLVATELEASGAQRCRPTGLSADGRTLFFWDERLGKERAGFFAYSTDSFSSFLDVGQLIDAQPNADCTRLYHGGLGVRSFDMFVATAR